MDLEKGVVEKIIVNSEHLKKWARGFEKKRYLFPKILSTSPQYFVGVSGMRGIGKTVLMLQAADVVENSVYYSVDSAFLQQHSVYETVSALSKSFSNIFIDEIHVKPNWAQDVKTIYDEHKARLFFSGSSALAIQQNAVDLSRRVVLHGLRPVSFREYLFFSHGIGAPVQSFEEIIEKKKSLAIKYSSAFDLMQEYMSKGGVMYSGEGFNEALENSLQKMITKDISSLREINVKYEDDAYKTLYTLAHSLAGEFSYTSTANKLGISKTFLIRLLSDLAKIGLIKIVLPCSRKDVEIKKEPKIFLTPPFRQFLNPNADLGVLREEFFAMHANPACYLKGKKGEKTPDFRVRNKIIEVGGESKTAYQSPDVIASDGLNFEGKHVPLFLFGLMY